MTPTDRLGELISFFGYNGDYDAWEQETLADMVRQSDKNGLEAIAIARAFEARVKELEARLKREQELRDERERQLTAAQENGLKRTHELIQAEKERDAARAELTEIKNDLAVNGWKRGYETQVGVSMYWKKSAEEARAEAETLRAAVAEYFWCRDCLRCEKCTPQFHAALSRPSRGECGCDPKGETDPLAHDKAPLAGAAQAEKSEAPRKGEREGKRQETTPAAETPASGSTANDTCIGAVIDVLRDSESQRVTLSLDYHCPACPLRKG